MNFVEDRNKKKFLLLTDSIANPRSFPEGQMIDVEQTYPYLLRMEYPDAVFWQLSFGNLETQSLIDQAIGYLSHWEPDFIIVHSGINDCRPEAFTELQKKIITSSAGVFSRFIYKHLYNPKLIKFRKKYRTTEKKFRKALLKLQGIFDNSHILVLNISAAPDYEKARPGVIRRINVFNKIIENIFAEDAVTIQEKLIKYNGFNPDNIHLNINGHKVIFDVLVKRIDNH